MSRKHLKDWPDCLKAMSIKELQFWLGRFERNARIWGPKVAKGALKRARLVEKEIELRNRPEEE
jgi:hypothetical protein